MSDKFIPSNYQVESLNLFGFNVIAHGNKKERHVHYNYRISTHTLLKALLKYAEKTNAEDMPGLRTLYDKVARFDTTYDNPDFECWNHHKNSAGYTDQMRFKTGDGVYARIERFDIKVNTYRFEGESSEDFIGFFAVEISNNGFAIANVMFRINVYETSSKMFDVVYSGTLNKDFDIHNELATIVVMNV